MTAYAKGRRPTYCEAKNRAFRTSCSIWMSVCLPRTNRNILFPSMANVERCAPLKPVIRLFRAERECEAPCNELLSANCDQLTSARIMSYLCPTEKEVQMGAQQGWTPPGLTRHECHFTTVPNVSFFLGAGMEIPRSFGRFSLTVDGRNAF